MPATEAHPETLCQETRPASHLQKLLCFLQIGTKVLLIPTAGTGATVTRDPFSESSGGSPAQGEGWLNLALVTSGALVPRFSGTRALVGLVGLM